MIRILLWIAIPIALFAIIFFIYQYINAFGFALPVDDKGQNSIGAWGTFGDYFGGTLNPILAFCSFLALLYTINLQNQQLKKTDEQLKQNKTALEQNARALEFNNQELKNSNQQLELSAKAQAEMEKTQKIQQFEGLFTFMLGELSDFKKSINDKRFNIGNYIDYNEYSYVYSFNIIRGMLAEDSEPISFFIYLYQILRLIDTQDNNFFSFQRKKQYSNLVRASIDDNSLKLLFLNCINRSIENNNDEFINLLEKFEFFEHLEVGFGYNARKDLIYYSAFYNKKVFGDSKNLKRALGYLINPPCQNENYAIIYDDTREILELIALNDRQPNYSLQLRDLTLISSTKEYLVNDDIQINCIEFSFNSEPRSGIQLSFYTLESKLVVQYNELKETFSYKP